MIFASLENDANGVYKASRMAPLTSLSVMSSGPRESVMDTGIGALATDVVTSSTIS
jgi:hypothetical protein